MYQKIVKFVSDNLLIPVSSYTVFVVGRSCASTSNTFGELGKNYKSIKNYMQSNITFNKSPFK
jgi:hypothetical protein